MSAAILQSPPEVTWILSGQLTEDQPVQSIHVKDFPFLVGRHPRASLTISSPSVSGVHAELRISEGRLYVKDLGSTNGTFVNGVRVEGELAIRGGDLLQFAEIVFRVSLNAGRNETKTVAGDSSDRALALIQFDKLMSDRAILPHYQPIVDVRDASCLGYEVLGRSRLFGLTTPRAMFSAAAVLDLESELSRLMRSEGIRAAAVLPGTPLLFVNTHPVELSEEGVLAFSLRELRELAPEARIVLEIHEAAVTCVREMRELRSVLADLDMQLAYDDFGAGQARLIELVEVPPEFLKFDIELIHGIDQASAEKQRMLQGLVKAVTDLGIVALAEGVETAAEHVVCEQLGFQLGQGFYYCKPAVAKYFAAEQPETL